MAVDAQNWRFVQELDNRSDPAKFAKLERVIAALEAERKSAEARMKRLEVSLQYQGDPLSSVRVGQNWLSLVLTLRETPSSSAR